MKRTAEKFRQDLRTLGISGQAVDAVWPSWWSDEAEQSNSAQVELRFTVARRLGLSPKSLLGKEEPTFVWRHEAKFKGLSTYGSKEQAALSSFGISLARILSKGVRATFDERVIGLDPLRLRGTLLSASPFVRLQDICAASWGLGIPVIHLRVFPLSAKHMVAMSVRHGDHFAILVAKDAKYPAPTAYHVAHELGHIASGHLAPNAALVDMSEPLEEKSLDSEELEADSFALRLLTGQASPQIEFDQGPANGAVLAAAVMRASEDSRIEPGTLAMCYGYQASDWATTYAALARIYERPDDVWRFLNRIATRELDWEAYSDDEADYLRAVMGGVELG